MLLFFPLCAISTPFGVSQQGITYIIVTPQGNVCTTKTWCLNAVNFIRHNVRARTTGHKLLQGPNNGMNLTMHVLLRVLHLLYLAAPLRTIMFVHISYIIFITQREKKNPWNPKKEVKNINAFLHVRVNR